MKAIENLRGDYEKFSRAANDADNDFDRCRFQQRAADAMASIHYYQTREPNDPRTRRELRREGR